MKIVPMNNLFEDVFDDIVGSEKHRHNPMRCDVYEKDGVYNIEVDVPGYSKEEINIETNDGYITIKASKNDEYKDEKNGKKYYYHERRFGKMERSFYIGNMDEDNIKAKMENGTLVVTIPMVQEKDTKKTIDIE